MACPAQPVRTHSGGLHGRGAPRFCRARQAWVSATRRFLAAALRAIRLLRPAPPPLRRLDRDRPAAGLAFQDLESGARDQRTMDVVLVQELLAHAVVLIVPVLRHVVPEAEFRDCCPVAGLIGGQILLQPRLRRLDRDDVEAAVIIRAVLGGGLERVNL